jgi:hypothetical protein
MVSEKNCSRALADFTGTKLAESTLGMFDLASGLEDIGMPRNLKMATLVKSDLSNHTFFETVAQNRGWTYRVFTDFREAVEWLKTA